MSCWCLERKHKTPKEHGTDVRNSTIYEISVLHECVNDHLKALNDPNTFSFLKLGLVQPRRASSAFVAFVRTACALPDAAVPIVMIARECRPHLHLICRINDVVLFKKTETELVAAQVWAFLDVSGELAAIVTFSDLVATSFGTATWRFHKEPDLVDATGIVAVVPWCHETEDVVRTITPAEFLELIFRSLGLLVRLI